MLNNCIIAITLITQQFYVSLTYHSLWSQTLHFIPFFPLDRLFLNRFCFEPGFLALRSSLLRSASSFKAETADLEFLSVNRSGISSLPVLVGYFPEKPIEVRGTSSSASSSACFCA